MKIDIQNERKTDVEFFFNDSYQGFCIEQMSRVNIIYFKKGMFDKIVLSLSK